MKVKKKAVKTDIIHNYVPEEAIIHNDKPEVAIIHNDKPEVAMKPWVW